MKPRALAKMREQAPLQLKVAAKSGNEVLARLNETKPPSYSFSFPRRLHCRIQGAFGSVLLYPALSTGR
jgi:hypothetical protein